MNPLDNPLVFAVYCIIAALMFSEVGEACRNRIMKRLAPRRAR